MTPKEFLTAGIAAYAAIVSTAAFCISLYSAGLATWTAWYDRHPRIRFLAAVCFLYSEGRGKDPKDPILNMTIINAGRVPVTIDTAAFRLPARRRWRRQRKQVDFWMPRPLLDQIRFPYELSPHKRCSIGVWGKEVAAALQEHGLQKAKLIPVCIDQTGKQHCGAATLFTVKELTLPDTPTA